MLEAGDALYLPPRIAHHGVSLDEVRFSTFCSCVFFLGAAMCRTHSGYLGKQASGWCANWPNKEVCLGVGSWLWFWQSTSVSFGCVFFCLGRTGQARVRQRTHAQTPLCVSARGVAAIMTRDGLVMLFVVCWRTGVSVCSMCSMCCVCCVLTCSCVPCVDVFLVSVCGMCWWAGASGVLMCQMCCTCWRVECVGMLTI